MNDDSNLIAGLLDPCSYYHLMLSDCRFNCLKFLPSTSLPFMHHVSKDMVGSACAELNLQGIDEELLVVPPHCNFAMPWHWQETVAGLRE